MNEGLFRLGGRIAIPARLLIRSDYNSRDKILSCLAVARLEYRTPTKIRHLRAWQLFPPLILPGFTLRLIRGVN